MRAVTLLPMVLPPVVGGIALLLALGRNGLVGQYLDHAGVHLPFHVGGAVLAETFVAMPFLVLTVEAAFRSPPTAASRTRRAHWARRGQRVPAGHAADDPAVARSRRGAVLGRALGEFGATITFAGNTQGKTQTLPLFVYVTLEGQQ